jgi:hypothetical protein
MSYTDCKPNEKKCPGCETVKELKGGYYKAGVKAYQSLCKCCHNKTRKNYKKNTYHKKGSGFKRLPEDLQNKIRHDVHIKIHCTNIYKRYKEEYPKLKYQTFLRWKRTGQILPPDNIEEDEEKKTENIENI